MKGQWFRAAGAEKQCVRAALAERFCVAPQLHR